MKKKGRPVGSKKTELPYLSETQLQSFMTALRKAKNLRDELFFKLVLYLGLRVTEATHLKLSDIKDDVYGIRVVGKKGGRTKTYEKIHPRIWRKLRSWIKQKGQTDNPYLFPSKSLYDLPIAEQTMKESFKRYAKKAGLPNGFSVHSLRHTCGIRLALQKKSPIEIQLWLRHRSLQSTMVYFEQVKFQNLTAEANETFDRFM